jgi:hypothetical protein
MSRDWNMHCKTCNATSETDFGHGEHILRGIAKAFPHIQAAQKADDSGYLEVSVLGHGEELIAFLNEHTGHDLDIISEYGDIEPIVETQPDKEQEA